MESHQEQRTIKINAQNTDIPIRFKHTYNGKTLRIRINRQDLITFLQNAYPNNLQNVNILFTVTLQLKNGAQHEAKFIIQETTMTASMNKT